MGFGFFKVWVLRALGLRLFNALGLMGFGFQLGKMPQQCHASLAGGLFQMTSGLRAEAHYIGVPLHAAPSMVEPLRNGDPRPKSTPPSSDPKT